MLVKDSITYLTARALPAVFGLGAVAVLTRTLSPSAYGQYALIVSAAGLMYALLFVWITQAAFRFYASAERDGELTKLLSTAFAGIAASLLVGTAGGAIAMGFLPIENPGLSFLACAVLTLSLAWCEFTSTNLNLERRSGPYVVLQMGRAVINLAIGGGAAYLTGSPFVVIMAVATSHIAITLLPLFNGWVRRVRWRAADRHLLQRCLRYGAPLSLSFGLVLLVTFSERVLISQLLDEAAVAEFSVAGDLCQFMIGALASAFSLAFYPSLVAAVEEQSPEAARAQLAHYGVVQFGMLLPASVGLAILAPALGRIVIGEEIRSGAVAAMPWMCGAMFFAGFRSYYTEFSFQLRKWTIGGPLTGLLMLAINLPLNMVVIPQFGVVGAAKVSFATYAFGALISALLGRSRGYPLPFPWRDLAKVALSALGMAASMMPLHGAERGTLATLQIVLGATTYLFLILLLNPMDVRGRLRSWVADQRERRVSRDL